MFKIHREYKPGPVARSDARSSGIQEVAGRSSGPATFFRGDWPENHFYGHSFPTADSGRAFTSYWRKNVH